jgi:serine/threonine-protein kinase RsbW
LVAQSISSYELPRRIAAVPEMHRLLRAHYDRLSIDEGTAFSLDLAAEEIFTNMVRHNETSGELITMTVQATREEIRLRWVDRQVAAFDPASIPEVDVTAPIEEREPGGLGLHLTRSLMDSVRYAAENGDMTVEAVKRLGA